MSLSSGTKLGPYEVLGTAGAGGMGEVYRARDTRLERTVAVKVLPPTFSRDPGRLRRFEQEARAVAALDHPNILAVHDIGSHEGAAYLVTEFLEGESLRQRLAGGALGQRKAIEYGEQIAQGLAAAHDKGIVHRDLKPENVFVTNDGRVKILDFGLAKLEVAPAAVEEGITAGTQTTPGVVMGTAGYMSPEQVRGQTADHRTDIFSFGAVLYEMLAGRRAFRGETSVETMNAILKEEPPELTATGLPVSPGLERIVRRCLEKKPEERFQSARDLAFALGALSATGTTVALRSSPARPAWQKWAAIAAVALVVAAMGMALALRRRPTVHPMQFAMRVRGEISQLALSRDGSLLAFVAPDEVSGKNMLYVQPLGAKSATVLAGTEGAMFPFWSPDNEYVGFFANGKLMKVRASGGTPQALAAVSATPRGGSWGSKNVIVYSMDSGGLLWRVNADGTNVAPLTEKMWARGESSHRWPLFLPDGEHFLFWSGNFQKEGNKIGFYLSSLSANEKHFVLPAWSNPGFSQPGNLFYVDEKGQLLIQEFDADAGSVRGEARVVTGVVGFQPALYWGAFAVSENGTVVSNPSAATSQSVLTWYDRTGKELGTVGQPGTIYNPALSPDGQRVAVDIADLKAANVDVWIRDLKRGTATRFTFDPAEETTPVWSPDGSRIAYRSSRAGRVKATNGLERESIIESLPSERDDELPTSWSPDGQFVLFTFRSGTGGSHLSLAKVGDNKMLQFIATKANETNGQISPDGKWLAYASDESGVWEIYVTTFPGAVGKWQVSQGGGTEPRWRGDGREMFYIGAKGMLTAVPISAGTTFSSGVPQPLFPMQVRAPISSTDICSYDVTKDGRRFIVNRYVKPAYVQPLDIVLNATTEGEGKR